MGQALVIQRVFANSPAEGNLQRGDTILKLNNCEATQLTHKRAQELFSAAGGQIILSIKRGQYIAPKKDPPKPKETQAYRTVPLELTGIASPKLGGGNIDLGTSYLKQASSVPAPPAMNRQSSKPWEDQEMLYKVHDTLSHIQYPFAAPTVPAPAQSGISCMNMYSGGPPAPAPAAVPAPPPYTPGPPPPQQDEEDDYEFVPVRQRRNQFNKADYLPQERKPIKPQRPPPRFAPAPTPPAAPKPMTPVHFAAPMTPLAPSPAPFRPAEGEVVQPATPAWAGTLSSAGGPKPWDAGVKPSHVSKPARSVSPQKKAAAAAPPSSGEFKPTQTKVIDFSNQPDDGPRVMHLQYNSPLDMYSKENVEETLQGQTQAALGGGNTVVPKKTPAEDRDWTQSALLRLIYEEETTNVPETAPLPPVEGTPRPAASPPKKVVASPAPTPPAVAPPAHQQIPSPVARPIEVPTGYSDF